MDKTETAQPDSASQTTATTNMDGATDAPQTTSGPERSGGAADVLQRYLKAQATQISRIAASLNQHRQDVQKLEVALIARIADVDDDRRHAATRLQRTLQTQRDELDERLKRQGSLMAMLLLVFSLLVAGTLVFFLFKLNATQEAFETQISDLQQTLEQIEPASLTEPDPQTHAQLERLSAALAGISKSIERLSEEATTTPLDLDLHLEPEPTLPAAQPEPEPEPEPEIEPAPEAETAAELETAPVVPTAISPALDPEPELESEPEPEPEPEPLVPDAAPSEPATEQPPAELEPTPASTEVESSPVEQETPLVEDAPSAPNPEEAAVPATADSSAFDPRSLMINSVPVGDRPFTIQLIGFHTLQALEDFAADSALPMVYYYREETYQGRPWFVLIYSLHQTREDAEAVVAKLPPELANLNIWIRRLKPETELFEVRRLGS
ncbi:SPOR domain-containing protein [Allochromatium palmeri]|uniref:SPOR domain-containing protein n=1 Tax=Allochromatium palmeri TaxID=231048 RepID=A0A6N8EBI5_9GAMM|nr:hypothetical protein [Allochromatium palmeri]MTW21535.1 hypothetical protein [Allochromatium palmeri]